MQICVLHFIGGRRPVPECTSLNIFLPKFFDKRELMRIHMRAFPLRFYPKSPQPISHWPKKGQPNKA